VVNIMPKYFMLFTCIRGLLFKHILTSLFSFLFRLVRSITCDFCSLNRSLFPLAHVEILLSSAFIIFSASGMDSTFVKITRSSANAIALV